MKSTAITERKPIGPICTREEARELLESLRAEYHKLRYHERMQVRMALQDVAPPIRSSIYEQAPRVFART
jgi:hypothetical protein